MYNVHDVNLSSWYGHKISICWPYLS